MVRNTFQFYILATALVCSRLASGTTILAGLEDTPGSSGHERNGDYNDMIFELTGNFGIVAPGSVFNNLSAGMVNENGTVFWDRPSGDGPDMNIGYMLLADSSFPNLQYLATPGGGSANNVIFDATGPVTLTLLGGITVNVQKNTLGWYNPADAGVLNQLIGWPDAVGESVTFNPDGDFALYSSDGRGQIYSSIAAANIGESGTQQHFAFFQPAAIVPQVPEPSTQALTGIGVGLLGLGLLPRRTPKP